MKSEICNISPWLDTDGNKIQAHGSSIYHFNDIFYWVGENKTGVTGRLNGECDIWHNGVNLYSSKDLYNWKNEGTILVSNDDKNPFHPKMIMDRPHIIYNEKTRKFVLWAKSAGKYKEPNWDYSKMAVAVADDIKGPYTFVAIVGMKEMSMGDFDLVKRPDGTAYIIYELPHTHIVCQKLTDDYTNITSEYKKHLESPYPPFTREAPCFFERNGKKYILTSGTTGYFPNATRIALISDDFKEFTDLGKNCINDTYDNSYGYQFSSVFKHPEKDLYIAIADKWLTDLPSPEKMPDVNEIFRKLFSGECTPEEFHQKLNRLTNENTQEATYAFLPIKFNKDIPYIEWVNSWKMED